MNLFDFDILFLLNSKDFNILPKKNSEDCVYVQTDTASVLNEAVEYIKFLQEQVTVSFRFLIFMCCHNKINKFL